MRQPQHFGAAAFHPKAACAHFVTTLFTISLNRRLANAHLSIRCSRLEHVEQGFFMNTVFKFASAFAIATGTIATAAYADKPAELSSSQLAAVQMHQYNVPSDVAFKAAISTLQSMGYMDIQASKDAGTIEGVTESKAKIIYNILWGFGKKKLTQKAAVLVEDNGPAGTVVRLNLLVAQTKARGIFGHSFSDGEMVKTAEPYNDFFTALDAEVKDRALHYVAAPAGTTVAPAQSVVSAKPITSTQR